MILTGKRKAATLLMSLDAKTANSLVKGLPSEKIKELAIELAQIDASGQNNPKQQSEIAREFWQKLTDTKQSTQFSIKSFLNNMLLNVVGKEKAQQIQQEIKNAVQYQDPFIPIKSADPDELVAALKPEKPQTIAVILSELPLKKSQQVLALFEEEIQTQTICKMTCLSQIKLEVKQLISSTVSKRLKAARLKAAKTQAGSGEKKHDPLRKLAVMLRGLENDLRTRLIDEISKKNKDNADSIKNLMILWEDIPLIADRSLQEIIRSIEAGALAKALYNADENIAQKIHSNISERAKETLEEEKSLMQEPEEKEILDAREEVLTPLREANEQGNLKFIKD